MPTIFRNTKIDEQVYMLLTRFGWDDETILLWIMVDYQTTYVEIPSTTI